MVGNGGGCTAMLMTKHIKWRSARAMRAYCHGGRGQMGQGDGRDTSNLDVGGEVAAMNERMSAAHAEGTESKNKCFKHVTIHVAPPALRTRCGECSVGCTAYRGW